MNHQQKETLVKGILFIFSLTASLILLLIISFLFNEGLPMLEETPLFDFLTGTSWSPMDNEFGALPFVVTTFAITIGALIVAIPLGLSCSIFLAEIAPDWARNITRPAIELLAGIPSIVYGLFGLVVIVDFIRISLDVPTGETILAGSMILSVMILPILISIAQDAIESVPRHFKLGSYAMGATDWQTLKKITIPAALPGIMTGIILGAGRAIGETMAVVLVLGNVEKIPLSPLDQGEALTSAILLEMGEAAVGSLHYESLFFLAIILFVITFSLSVVSNIILEKAQIKVN